MHMPEEVTRAADELLNALKRTEAFEEYNALRRIVMADEVNCRLLERLNRAQSALQMAAMAGSEPREDDVHEFEKLSALLYENPDITDYLLAQMKVQQLVAATMEKLTREAGIRIDLPDA